MLKAVLSAVVIALCGSARAGTLDVTWTEPGESASWQQSTNPTPIAIVGDYTEVPVSDASPSSISGIFYYTPVADGGFEDNKFFIVTSGDQVFSGSLAAPVFSAGQYLQLDLFTGQFGFLTFTAVSGSVPEPSTWAMMLIGFAGLGFVGYRASRRTKVDALA